MHRTTAFRWRQRFPRLASAVRATALAGVAEADTLRSSKGQCRRLLAEQSRPPRRRGGRAAKRGLSSEQVPILVLRERSGQPADYSRYKNPMRRFDGVATAYLENDLGWFRALDRHVHNGAPSAAFLALAIGA